MNSSRDEQLANPFWYALNTEHTALAIGTSLARRYPAEVVPFAGLEEISRAAMAALRELLAPGEAIYVTGDDLVVCDGMEKVGELAGWQMLYPDAVSPASPGTGPAIEDLDAEDAAAMVALTDVAFPGYFRAETYRMGRYYGIRIDGILVAMAGERIALPGCREISAVCTHPAHLGRGYAAQLIGHILRAHRAAGLDTFLHVTAVNLRAIQLYQRLGFVTSRAILFNHLRRVD